MKYKIQLNKNHYNKSNYDGIRRFISYFHQINLIKKLNPKKVLEIGIGNATVSNYLKNQGLNITTCDFDKSLNPDIVASLPDLPIKENSYDLVCAF